MALVYATTTSHRKKKLTDEERLAQMEFHNTICRLARERLNERRIKTHIHLDCLTGAAITTDEKEINRLVNRVIEESINWNKH